MDHAARAQLQKDMVALAEGDRAAFEPVFRALWPVLRALVARQMPGAEAEDVAQDALLKLFSRASEFSARGDALAWAVGIATYEVRTARKRHLRRREDQGGPPERSGEGPTLEDVVLQKELEAAAREVLGTLRPEDERTLRAVISGERPDVTGATFRKRVQRAMHRFRVAWRATWN